MGNSCLSEVAKTSILKTELPAPILLSSQLVTARAAASYRVAELRWLVSSELESAPPCRRSAIEA